MLAVVKYLGYYPLGSDVELNGVKIMQEYWNEYDKFIIPIGKKNVVSPFMQQVFYVISKDKIVFFVAIEYGLGHYYIFSISDKKSKLLEKKVNSQKEYNHFAVEINKVASSVKAYGRIIIGSRDQNYKIADSFFELIDTKVNVDYTLYIFTNNGEDRFYLEVYNPELVETSQNYVLIGKATKVVWRWETKEEGLQIVERRMLKNYVENKYICNSQERITFYR